MFFKFVKQTMLLIAITCLSACSINNAETLFSPLSYHATINAKSNKQLFLVWKTGEIYESGTDRVIAPASGIIASIIALGIEEYDHTHYAGRYTYSYGTARQAIFMTSLRNILLHHKVFKTINLVAKAPKQLGKNDALITVNFKETRVGREIQSYPITIDVLMTMRDATGKVMYKHYLVQSDKVAIGFSRPSFVDQQTQVSNRLLKKIISGISHWLKRDR